MTADDIVYHYTSHDAAMSIVRNEEVWLTNILYLNDVKEFWGTFDQVRRYIDERAAAGDTVRTEIVEQIEAFIDRRPGTSICVTCFSAHADDAAQWQRYASHGGGVAIGYRKDKLVAACGAHKYLFADSVQYSTEETMADIDRIVRAVEDAIGSGDKQTVVNPLIRLAAFNKDQSFASEQEFRFARQGVPYTEYRFFARSDNLVPYYNFPLKRDCIARVQLGPKSDPECQYS